MSELEPFEGYTGRARRLLESKGARVWSRVRVRVDDLSFEALVLPAPAGTDDVIYFKLENGYNIGFRVDRIKELEVLAYERVEYRIREREIRWKPGLPHVVLVGAGGTIASRVEYSTGAVKPAFSIIELLNANPELAEIARISTVQVFNIFSEHMTPRHWIELARRVAEVIRSGADGVVICHGTDTMHYTSAALSFMLENLPVPVVLTGAQRSSDRPSSDASVNLISSTLFAARSDCAEVVVCMHAFPDDIACFVHRGTRVRKMHSSRRDTFQSIGDLPIAIVLHCREIRYLRDDYRRRASDKSQVEADAVFEERTALIWCYPGMPREVIDVLVDRGYRGIVLAGTGLGHAPEYVFPAIRRAIEEGCHVVMTTQCLYGGVQMYVYETGRRLLQMGVIPGENMLPEVAYVKLGWVLAHTDDRREVERLMRTNLRGEIVPRERVDTFWPSWAVLRDRFAK